MYYPHPLICFFSVCQIDYHHFFLLCIIVSYVILTYADFFSVLVFMQCLHIRMHFNLFFVKKTKSKGIEYQWFFEKVLKKMVFVLC